MTWNRFLRTGFVSLAMSAGLAPSTPAAGAAGSEPDRTVLPLVEPITPAITEMDARKATPPRASR